MAHEDKYGINRRGLFMRQCTLAATGIAFAALLSSAPAMAQATNQAYNTDVIGWNRGGQLTYDTTGKEKMCFKSETGKYDGPVLEGTSDAATHGWQNFWGPCVGAAPAAKSSRHAARH
jgi:hypothetical protein